jgi:hypothetical protein
MASAAAALQMSPARDIHQRRAECHAIFLCSAMREEFQTCLQRSETPVIFVSR